MTYRNRKPIPAPLRFAMLCWRTLLGLPRRTLSAFVRLLARIVDTSGRIRYLEGELARATGLLAGSPEIIHAEVAKHGMTCELKHPFFGVLVEALGCFLDDPLALNYVTMAVYSARHGMMDVTVKRAGRKSPAEVIGELQARIAELESAADSA